MLPQTSVVRQRETRGMKTRLVDVVCPCDNWAFQIRIPANVDEVHLVAAAAGGTGLFSRMLALIRSSDELDEANKWVNNTCVRCGCAFEYNRLTGEVRQMDE